MSRIHTIVLLSVLAMVLTVSPAFSTAITTFNDLAAWQLAQTGGQLVDFNGYTAGTTYTGPTGLTDTGTGVEFIGLTTSSITLYDTSTVGWMNFGTGKAPFVNQFTTTSPTIHIVLPSPVTAVALEIFTANPNAGTALFTVLANQSTIPTYNTPTTAFFGVTSDTPFTTVDVAIAGYSSGQYLFIDNFRFGTANVVAQDPLPGEIPEAATSLLIGSGLIGLVLWQRKVRNGRNADTLPVTI